MSEQVIILCLSAIVGIIGSFVLARRYVERRSTGDTSSPGFGGDCGGGGDGG